VDVSRGPKMPQHSIEIISQLDKRLDGHPIMPVGSQLLHHLWEPHSLRITRGHVQTILERLVKTYGRFRASPCREFGGERLSRLTSRRGSEARAGAFAPNYARAPGDLLERECEWRAYRIGRQGMCDEPQSDEKTVRRYRD
jgi:hypothetical protein